jgi:hypothetical protein
MSKPTMTMIKNPQTSNRFRISADNTVLVNLVNLSKTPETLSAKFHLPEDEEPVRFETFSKLKIDFLSKKGNVYRTDLLEIDKLKTRIVYSLDYANDGPLEVFVQFHIKREQVNVDTAN